MSVQEIALSLRELLERVEAAQSTVDEAQAKLDATEEAFLLKNARETLSLLREQAAATKQQLSETMLNSEEIKWPGIGQVIETKRVVVFDKAAALKWAIEHKTGLALDEKVILKIADTLQPDGVRIEHSRATRIASQIQIEKGE